LAVAGMEKTPSFDVIMAAVCVAWLVSVVVGGWFATAFVGHWLKSAIAGLSVAPAFVTQELLV